MKRREFITLLGGAAAAWPLAARAQQAKIPVIGLLSVQTPVNATSIAAFRQGLKNRGYFENENVAIDYSYADGQNDRLSALAAGLVRRQVAVIYANDNASALAAKAATSTTPIVFSVGADPVSLGLVTNINRPGGNMTGVSFLSTATVAIRLEMLHEAVPKARVVAILVNPINPNAEPNIREAEDAAQRLGLELRVLDASTDQEIDAAFETLVERKIDALHIEGDAFLGSRQERLAALASQHAIPAIYSVRTFTEAGGLMSYGSSPTEWYRLCGDYVGRILKGDKPGELPVQQVTKVELIINLQTAKALGITFPQLLLGRADEIIE
jgi:putative ABC transport system substrate-binding protein